MLARRATEQRPHPRDDFADREWLREVIVSAEIQTFDSLVYIPARGEKEHWRIHTLSAHLAQDAEPVASWQHDVEDNCVVCLSENSSECRASIVDEVNDQILLREAVAQKASEFLLVFHHQHSHAEKFKRPRHAARGSESK